MEFFKSGSVGGAGSNVCFYPEAKHHIIYDLSFTEASVDTFATTNHSI